MNSGRAAAFATLKIILAKHANRLAVRADTSAEYTLTAKSPSPFPQHKGHPLEFASVRISKSYVSFHLMPVYMNSALGQTISPLLQKRMQGKTCFNFRNEPEPGLIAEISALTEAALRDWSQKQWV